MPDSRASGSTQTGLPRRDFLRAMGLGTLGLLARGTLQAQPPRKPNIVVIVADDLGYADVGVHGCTDVPTPHIDSIARNGLRFTSGYVSCPVCSPTRAGLVTARYQQRFGHEFNTGPQSLTPEGAGRGLPLSQITIANVLKQAGYATGIVGKWHLGMAPEFHPFRRGFDEFFGFLHGGHPYLDPALGTPNPILRGTDPVDEKEYLTDAFGREAVAFLDRHREHPFFLYLPFNAVHTPLQAPQKYVDRFAAIEDRKRRTYAAMLTAMDEAIGAVLARLRQHGLERDTLVFFFSDNGGPPNANASSNAPLRGAKGTMYEGGIRVPFLVQWPARLRAGQVYDQPVISLDVFPTAAAAAGAAMPADRPIDGVDLTPFLTGQRAGAPHDALFWRSGANYAMRRGRHKLVRLGERAPELYDLEEDISEGRDLAAGQGEVVAELTKSLDDWAAQLVAPLWGAPGRARARTRRNQQQDD